MYFIQKQELNYTNEMINKILEYITINDIIFAVFISAILGTFINIKRKVKLEFSDTGQRYVYVVKIEEEEITLFSDCLFEIEYVLQYAIQYLFLYSSSINGKIEGEATVQIYDRRIEVS